MTSAARPHPALAGFLIALAILFLAWPSPSPGFATGIDYSWRHALHLAEQAGLHFGSQITYTYGPLGFLSIPVPQVGLSSAMAVLVSGAVYLGLIGMALRGLRRVLPLWAAAIVTLIGARMFIALAPFDAFQVLWFLVCIELVLGRVSVDDRVVVIAMAAAGAVAVLGKLNVGAFVVAMGAITVWAVVRQRLLGLATYLAAVAGFALVIWVAMGQVPTDIPAFVQNGYEIIAGYSQAMAMDREAPRYHWVYLAFIVVASIIAWLAVGATRGLPRTRQAAVFLLLALLVFAQWKVAVVRDHEVVAFATFAFAATGLVERAGRQATLTSLAAILLVFLATAPPTRTSPAAYFDVAASVRQAVDTVRAQLLPWNIGTSADATRADLRERYDLSDETIALLDGRRTHIEPDEASVAFAYPELVWDPLPVIQNFTAYTAALDDLQADRLRGPDRPERILREYEARSDGQPYAIDWRNYWWDAPATMFERLCRYRVLSADRPADPRWQVLGATDRACGAPIPLKTVRARAGEEITVPPAPPGHVVTVRIDGVEGGLRNRIRTMLLESREWYASIDGTTYRFVPGTAAQPHVVAVPDEAQDGAPFGFGPAMSTISIRAGLWANEVNDALTYTFEAYPIVDEASAPASTSRPPGSAPTS